MRCLDCLFGGPFLIMLLPAFNHLGDLLRVLRRGVVAPHLRFYPMFWGSPSGFLLLNPPESVHPCIIQVSSCTSHKINARCGPKADMRAQWLILRRPSTRNANGSRRTMTTAPDSAAGLSVVTCDGVIRGISFASFQYSSSIPARSRRSLSELTVCLTRSFLPRSRVTEAS